MTQQSDGPTVNQETYVHPSSVVVPPARPAPPRRRSLFWPIALIAFGVLLLLSNLGIVPATGWAVLWRFWPIALVALGIDVLIGRRSVAGAIASGILMLVLVGTAIGIALFAEQIPALVDLARPATLQRDQLVQPLEQTEEATVTIDWTSAPGTLSALVDSPNLMEANIAYRGELIYHVERHNSRTSISLDTMLQGIPYSTLSFDDSQQRWDVELSPEVILDLVLDTSTGACSFDLRDLNVRSLVLDAGTGSIDLSLPGERDLEALLDGGSGAITIDVPDDAGLRLHLDGGSGGFHPGDDLELVRGDEDDGTWESSNFDRADYQIVLTVDQGSGSLRIE